MSKDKKKSKVRQISIAKHLLKGYSVFEWSDRGSHSEMRERNCSLTSAFCEAKAHARE